MNAFIRYPDPAGVRQDAALAEHATPAHRLCTRRSMRVVMLVEFYGETLAYQENLLAKYYVKLGHQVTIITSTIESVFDYIGHRYDRTKPARVYAGSDGSKIIRLPFRINILNRFRFFRSLREILEAERPDLIFVHDIAPNIIDAARYVRSRRETMMIMDYHGDYGNSVNGWLSRHVLHGILRKRILERARPFLQKIFPIVPGGVSLLRELYSVPERMMELLPLGVDFDLSRRVMAEAGGARVRERLGIPKHAIVVFTGGKLSPLKQTGALVEAFALMNRSDTWLIVAGDAAPEDVAYLREIRVRASGLPKVLFTGWLDSIEMHRHLDAADLAVFPASQSVLWQQAIGMGKPLVLADRSNHAGGVHDASYLNRYGNVLFADVERYPSLPSALAAAMTRLIDNPAERHAMSKGASRVAEEMLDYNMLAKRTLRFCRGSRP